MKLLSLEGEVKLNGLRALISKGEGATGQWDINTLMEKRVTLLSDAVVFLLDELDRRNNGTRA